MCLASKNRHSWLLYTRQKIFLSIKNKFSGFCTAAITSVKVRHSMPNKQINNPLSFVYYAEKLMLNTFSNGEK